MKKLLYVLLIINIISITIGFIILLPISVLLALLYLTIAALSLVPTIAVIRLLDDIELMQDNITHLYNKLHKLENLNQNETSENPEPAARHGEEAKPPWKCVKCGTVNKAGTTNCSNCDNEFSPTLNQTFHSNPKALSRWIKPKKKKS